VLIHLGFLIYIFFSFVNTKKKKLFNGLDGNSFIRFYIIMIGLEENIFLAKDNKLLFYLELYN
jgi:hypothetical protein